MSDTWRFNGDHHGLSWIASFRSTSSIESTPMKRILLLSLLLFVGQAYAQQTEPSRYEVVRWGKNQSCHFESFHENGGMMVYETDKTDENKNRLWGFVSLDSCLYEQGSDFIPLPSKFSFFDSKSTDPWAAFVFLNEKASKSDSVPFFVVAYNRYEQSFSTFRDCLPGRSSLLSISLIDNGLLFAVNLKAGGGMLMHYDLDSHQQRVITPDVGNDIVLFQATAVPEGKAFVVAAREYVNKHYKATSFLVYSREGRLLQTHRFENGENAVLGRMCFAFDRSRDLMVYATLERESGKKVDLDGVTEDFSKIAIGVTWIKFASSGLRTRTYLFKDLPEIENALTPSDRLRVREELLKMQRGKKKERGEIAFQFLTPRLVRYGGQWVFSAEAFQPIYHTETRMGYGFYGSYPTYYTVFDGYDFFSEILLAFDEEGELQWQTSVRFENDLSEQLTPHAVEAVVHDELVVVSPSRNKLRYEVFDKDGTQLLDQHGVRLDFLNGADSFEDEYYAGIYRWYGDCFLVHGCQILHNAILRNPNRTVFYVQKAQYE